MLHPAGMMSAGMMSGGLAVAGWLLLAAAVFGDDSPSEEQQQFQGEWRVLRHEHDGEELPAESLAKMRWQFAGNRVSLAEPEVPTRQWTAKLTLRETSRQIDLIAEPEEGAEASPPRVMLGIYEWDEGRLRLCLRDSSAVKKGRPAKFATREVSGLSLIVLERVK